MIDFNRENYETAGARSDRQPANWLPFSRRSFLVKTSCFGVFYALAKLMPWRVLAAELLQRGFEVMMTGKSGRVVLDWQ